MFNIVRKSNCHRRAFLFLCEKCYNLQNLRMQKTLKIFLYTTPALLMIGLIPLVQNDYILTALYASIIIVLLVFIKCKKSDITVLLFGFVIITFFEYIFVSTGVETFSRNSLFNIMPLWLPFLWAYGFIAIKRSIEVLNNYE